MIDIAVMRKQHKPLFKIKNLHCMLIVLCRKNTQRKFYHQQSSFLIIKAQANLYKSNQIDFKFSINGKDNEMVSGTDHHFICNSKDGVCATPVIKFGTQLK